MSRTRWALLVAVVVLIGVGLWWALSGSAAPGDVAAGGGSAVVGAGAQPGPSGAAKRPAAVASVDADAAAAPSSTGAFATFGWGAGTGDLGRNRPTEGNPEGPMSLTVDASGAVWILDQVNGRLVKLGKDGKPASTVKVSVQAPQDVVVTKDGTALVLDRLADKSVGVVAPDGTPKGELPIVGKGLPEGGASTGVFADGKDVYVEREHADLVRVGHTDGTTDPERPEVPGRPTRDGKTYLTANIVEAPAGRVMVTAIDRATRAHRFTREYTIKGAVLGLNLLDSDATGVIYLGALVETAAPAGGAGGGGPGILVLCADPLDGKPLGHASFPANTDADETFRELTLADDGTLYFLHRTETGAELLRARCGP